MTNDTTALDFFNKLAYGYVSDSAVKHRYGYALHITPNALGRFGQVAGWLTGLTHAGKADLAGKLAEDFDRALKGALRNCIIADMPVVTDHRDEVEGTVRVPHTKVVLSDDGTFGGFGLSWHRAIGNRDFIKRAAEIDPEAYSGDLPDNEYQWRWAAAREKAAEAFGIRKELEEFRYYTPTWVNEDTPSSIRTSSTLVHYGFLYNGGLLYHGPGGGEVFAVTLGDVRGWSVHT